MVTPGSCWPPTDDVVEMSSSLPRAEIAGGGGGISGGEPVLAFSEARPDDLQVDPALLDQSCTCKRGDPSEARRHQAHSCGGLVGLEFFTSGASRLGAPFMHGPVRALGYFLQVMPTNRPRWEEDREELLERATGGKG